MNSSTRTVKRKHKGSFFKRLVRNSFILSCLDSLSARVFRLFRGSFFYLVLCGSDETDALLKRGIIGSLAEKVSLGERLFRPLKLFFATGIENSRIVYAYRRAMDVLLSVSVRFFGILGCTVGIYGIGIYLAKRYAYIAAEPSESELFWAAFFIISGAPLLLSGKGVSQVLKSSKIFSWLFIGILGVNEMTLREGKKPNTHGTAAFVLGTVLGLSTIFISPAAIIYTFLLSSFFATVLYVPELGLLGVIMLFPLISVKRIAVLLIITTVFYIFKVLRSKRNLSLKTADIFVLFFGLYIIAAGIISGSGGQVRAAYLICFLAVYFLISNLIASERLIRQALYSFCTGAFASCLLFILHHIAGKTANIYITPVLGRIDFSLVGSGHFGFYLLLLMPVCMALFRVTGGKSEKAALLILLFLSVICIALTADRLILTCSYAILFLYALFAYKKPFSTLLTFSVITVVLYFCIPYTPVFNEIFSGTAAGLKTGQTEEMIKAFMPTGVGIGGTSIIIALNKIGASNYIGSLSLFERLIAEGGLFYLFVFLLGAYFILQRAFNCLAMCGSKRVLFVVSSLISGMLIFLAAGLFFDVWQDIRLYMLFWIICGVITAFKNVYGRNAYIKEALSTV